MLPFKVKTKWFEFELGRRGIVFTVASLLLTTGAAMCSENLWVLIITRSIELFTDRRSDSIVEYIGAGLILVSLYLFYLVLINWRKEVYSKLFQHVQEAYHAMGTAYRAQGMSFSPEALVPLHTASQEKYEKALTFLYASQPLLDDESFVAARKLLNDIGHEAIHLDTYIRTFREVLEEGRRDFDPERAVKDTAMSIRDIKTAFSEFVSLIRQKENYVFR